MIGLEEAQQRLFALASPLSRVSLPLIQSSGRYLYEDIAAKRTQPAADLSAMDGYAIRFADLPGDLNIIGESAAGRPFEGALSAGHTVRIFTGAHVPRGADTILIQEDAAISAGTLSLTGDGPGQIGLHIRKTGSDFQLDQVLLSKGQLITPGVIAAAAMANHAALPVHAAPKISIIGTGDELALPGSDFDSSKIPSSNNVMLSAMLAPYPCDVTDHGIAADSIEDLKQKFINCSGSDVIITSGGASVGDHDLVHKALLELDADMSFWRVAIRPGKPILAGKLGKAIFIGLPGNPSSAFVTAVLFVLPLMRYLLGAIDPLPAIRSAIASREFAPGGNRTEFIRARVDADGIRTFGGQDSGLTVPLASANALLIREANAPASSPNFSHKYIIL